MSTKKIVSSSIFHIKHHFIELLFLYERWEVLRTKRKLKQKVIMEFLNEFEFPLNEISSDVLDSDEKIEFEIQNNFNKKFKYFKRHYFHHYNEEQWEILVSDFQALLKIHSKFLR